MMRDNTKNFPMKLKYIDARKAALIQHIETFIFRLDKFSNDLKLSHGMILRDIILHNRKTNVFFSNYVSPVISASIKFNYTFIINPFLHTPLIEAGVVL